MKQQAPALRALVGNLAGSIVGQQVTEGTHGSAERDKSSVRMV
ncbi:MAG TPA: hypothetical protein VJ180_13280 [Pyrinomonadaceae bacterium]|nr:hypothetical protein [Pyrinomonadaceae bacterium]